MNQAAGALHAYISSAEGREESISQALIRTKSTSGREILAHLATRGLTSATTLEDHARDYRSGVVPDLELDAQRALEYARVLAVQTGARRDLQAAQGLILWIRETFGPATLSRRDAALLVQLALKARDFTLSEEALQSLDVPVVPRQVASTDLANPWIRPGKHEAGWLEQFNSNLYRPTTLPIDLLPEGQTPFDRLTRATKRSVTHTAKVTVVISCYNPDHHLVTAVRSVIEQTWQNFELFVVDDASPTPTPGVLELVARMDPRVRVIRKAINGGTYRARNTVLRQATGDFFTCLDSDDWAHPQRLELGVRPMLSNPSVVATRGQGVRATENMELTRIGYAGRLPAASSLMIRTDPVVNRLGFFDAVRKAADNEYAARVEASFGQLVEIPRDVLTVLLADPRSLSASDYTWGWRHPARAEYAEAAATWHKEVRSGNTFLLPHGPRPFPGPRRWERHPQDGPAGSELDIVVVADWRERLLMTDTVEQLRQWSDRGHAVGIVHHESLARVVDADLPLAPAVRELLQRGAIERLYLDDVRSSALTVLADPRVMQFPPSLTPQLTSSRVIVLARPDLESACEYVRTDVEQHTYDLLGVDPEWSPRWPGVPDATSKSPGVMRSGVAMVELATQGQAVAHGDVTVEGGPIREGADGEHVAHLSVIRQDAGQGLPDVRELSDAWAAGTGPWEVTAAEWLSRTPSAWLVVVQTIATTRAVVAAGIRTVAEADDRLVLRLEARPESPAAELLEWQAGRVTRRTIARQRDV